ncbi:MAG: phosphoribosylanthranilate isomerase [Rhodocyclaceae bacterium]
MDRTRIKICGLTREEDVGAATTAGADAIGLVFYAPSPRAVDIERARALCRVVPPFVSVVGLFVNEDPGRVREILAEVPLSLLQFHGDESVADCERYDRPYLKAARVRADLDLINYAAGFPSARGLLLDAFVDGYGGGGQTFDWSLIPADLPLPVILSGGLAPHNVEHAVRHVRPWAVDVSSGVEAGKGIKDAALIRAFISGVRNADG